ERSSLKWKEMWRTIQIKANNVPTVQLILDIKCVDAFVGKNKTLQNMIRYHANNAQQAFSSENAPTLHLGIPALEALYKAWSSCVDRPEFEPFAPALCAAYEKIDEYYEKTTESPAYIMSMILNPNEKMGYFKKHLPANLHEDVLKCVEDENLVMMKKMQQLIQSLMYQMTLNGHGSVTSVPMWMFLSKFQKAGQQSGGGVALSHGIISQLCHHLFQGGITISKRCNRLKDDIVEALQCIKCALQYELLFREHAPSSISEAEEIGDQEAQKQEGLGRR
ncbi:hypothetical protein BGY98DRAFT_940614, partial [Russula aff. rugulosa BPL654]